MDCIGCMYANVEVMLRQYIGSTGSQLVAPILVFPQNDRNFDHNKGVQCIIYLGIASCALGRSLLLFNMVKILPDPILMPYMVFYK